MTLETKHKAAVIFILAVIMRLLFSFGLVLNHNPLISVTGDAQDYLYTASNFLDKGIWSSSPAENPEPDNFRAPIYPFFLMFFHKFNISLEYVGLIQDLIMALTAVLIYILGRKIFFETAAFFAAVFFALDPYLASPFVSKAIMTEAFAVFFLIVSLFNLGIYIREKTPPNLYWGSFFLALTALIKPQFFIFGFFIFLAVFLAGEHRNFRQFAASGLIFFTLLSPWLYYNFFTLKVFQFSSNPYAAFYQSVGFFQEFLKGGHGPEYNDYTWDRARQRFGVRYDAQLFEPHRAKELADLGFKFIIERPFSFAFYHITRIPRLFWHDNTIGSIARSFGIRSVVLGPRTDIDIIKDIFNGKFYSAWSEFRSHPIWLVSIFLKLTILSLSLLAFLNFFLRWKLGAGFLKISLFFLLFIFLYAVMVSPLGQQRYRVPIYPLILILAFDGIRLIYLRFHKNIRSAFLLT